jgi:hypothetical protein
VRRSRRGAVGDPIGAAVAAVPARIGASMERVYAAWALGLKTELQFVWGQYTDGGPEWDIDVDASMAVESTAAGRSDCWRCSLRSRPPWSSSSCPVLRADQPRSRDQGPHDLTAWPSWGSGSFRLAR